MYVTKSDRFDIAFVGLGAANSLLALRLHDHGLLENKRIVVIDPSVTTAFERTFCFWSTPAELSALKIDTLVRHSWHTIRIPGITEQCIAPMHYYHVSGATIRENALRVLNFYDAVFLEYPMHGEPVVNKDGYVINIGEGSVVTSKVYDSRPPVFSTPGRHQSHLLQSFRGWVVDTSTACFDPSKMVLMDFNVPQSGATQFVYVLPFSDKCALVELTRFGLARLTEEEAGPVLHNYVSALDQNYTVNSKETGVIPMSSCALEVEDYGPGWIHTGTRAALLKATTGYAFHAMAEDAMMQADKYKNNRTDERKKSPARFAFYDRLLLKNHLPLASYFLMTLAKEIQ